MTRSTLAVATLAGLLALGGCGSDDDDDAPAPGTDAADTSEEAPDRALSSEPGGDTRAVAGYWNATGDVPGTEADARFVVIAENGLHTEYRLARDDVTAANCYLRYGPQTLTPDGADGYALDDGTDFVATRSEDGTALTVDVDGTLVETWRLVEGRTPEDLPLCGPGEGAPPGEGPDASGPGGSTLNPDLEGPAPDTAPSGDDTAAIEGLWDATGGPEGRGDARYVAISGDGLGTEYDYRDDDLAGEGNCHVVTARALELELGDAADGTFSIAGGGTFDVVDAGADGTLVLTFSEPDAPGRTGTFEWPRVEGVAVEDLAVCDG